MQVTDSRAEEEGPEGECPWENADECSMARERSVAGVSDVIPDCPVHGAFRGEA